MSESRDFDADLLFEALDEKRTSLGLTWSGVAREFEQHYIRVAPGTIKGIRDKSVIEGDGCLQMLLWLGRSPESFVPGAKPDACHDLPELDNTVLRFDVVAIWQLLDARRAAHSLTWDEVADQVGGVPASMLQRFQKGGRTSFPAIIRIARWLEVPVGQLTRQLPKGGPV